MAPGSPLRRTARQRTGDDGEDRALAYLQAQGLQLFGLTVEQCP